MKTQINMLSKRVKIALSVFSMVTLIVSSVTIYLALNSTKDPKSTTTNNTNSPVSYSQSQSDPTSYTVANNSLKPIDISSISSSVAIFSNNTAVEVLRTFENMTMEFREADNDSIFVHNYYNNLSAKNYDEVYRLGSQGRTVDEIKKLYNDIAAIYVGRTGKEANDNNKIYTEVTLQDDTGNMTYYEVTLMVERDADSQITKIVSSSSNQIFPEIILDCQQYDEVNFKHYECYLRDNDSLHLLLAYRGSVGSSSLTLTLGRTYDEKIYLYDFGGAANVEEKGKIYIKSDFSF